ncbi:MAG: exodeoxyribonuclease VII small subunit [Actinobacteria bacterium]|nr:MAG: exodeoxyribonuclease VII small subunit [Actinomycetota bacterium]
MADEKYTFEQAKIRLEEIAALARKKDTSLEKSLDLLEEGVRLANICTELVDHTDLSATATVEVPEDADASASMPAETDPVMEEPTADPTTDAPQVPNDEVESQ